MFLWEKLAGSPILKENLSKIVHGFYQIHENPYVKDRKEYDIGIIMVWNIL